MARLAPLMTQEPYTIRRLREIKPGERIVYYRGRLPCDIHSARGYAAQCHHESAAALILEEVCAYACDMAIAGRAKLTETTVVIGRRTHKRHTAGAPTEIVPATITEYAVVGL